MHVASLPWYDPPEVQHANDLLWSGMAQRLRKFGVKNVPDRLNRSIHYERQWMSPNFLFGQACGYDVAIANTAYLQVVATPRYRADGCCGNRYSSYVVVRQASTATCLKDLRGSRCVINTPTSHSGMNILRALVAPLHHSGRFFTNVQVSGSHEASLRRLQAGEADLAAIDCVTYELFERHRPALHEGLRILCQTKQLPAPPFVTSKATRADTVNLLRAALTETLNDSAVSQAKEDLLLDGVDLVATADYRAIEELEYDAHELGYSELSCTAMKSVQGR